MDIRERKIPWWLIIITGVIIIAVGIFVLADRVSGLNVLIFLIGLGALAFAVFNFVIAFKTRNTRQVSLSHIVHGLIDIVLLLLIIVMRKTPTLLGIIIACWLIIFGVFEVITARQNDQPKRSKMGVLLVLIGLVVLIIPLIFSIDYLILIGIVGIVFGVYRTILGIIIATKRTGQTTSLR